MIELKILQSVGAGQTVTDDHTVTNGKEFIVNGFHCGYGDHRSVEVSMLWDGALVWRVTPTAPLPLKKVFTGDGVKKITLQVKNNEVTAETVTASLTGKER